MSHSNKSSKKNKKVTRKIFRKKNMRRGGGPGDNVKRAIEGYPGYIFGFGKTDPRPVKAEELLPFFNKNISTGEPATIDNVSDSDVDNTKKDEFNKISWEDKLDFFSDKTKDLLTMLVKRFKPTALRILFNKKALLTNEASKINIGICNDGITNINNILSNNEITDKIKEAKQVLIDTIKTCDNDTVLGVLDTFDTIVTNEVTDEETNNVSNHYVNIDETTGNSALHYAAMNSNPKVFKTIYDKLVSDDYDDDEKISNINKTNIKGKRAIDILADNVLKFNIDEQLRQIIEQTNFEKAKATLTDNLENKNRDLNKNTTNATKKEQINVIIERINNAMQVITDKEQELHNVYDDSIKQKNKPIAAENAFVTINAYRNSLPIGKNNVSIKSIDVIWDIEKQEAKEPVRGFSWELSFSKEDADKFKNAYDSKLKELCDADFQTVLNEYPDVKSFTKSNAPSPIVQREVPPPIAPGPVQAAGKRSRKNRRKSKGKSNRK